MNKLNMELPTNILRRFLTVFGLSSLAIARRMMTQSEVEQVCQQLRVADWFAISGDKTLRLDYPLDSSSRVIDAGGFEGSFSTDIAAKYGSIIDIFEPDAAYAQRLRHLFSSNSQVQVHDSALWSADSRLEFSSSGDQSSLVVDFGNASTISAVDVSRVVREIGYVHLLKLNVEGAEYEILERLLATGAIGSVGFLQVQFHNFAPDAHNRRNAIRTRLRESHNCDWSIPWVWESWSARGS
jgi:FkbM family methyltransferase